MTRRPKPPVRRRMPAASRRDHVIRVPVNVEELAAARDGAGAAQRDVADWIRVLIRTATGNPPTT